jgi:hypothetical protein
MVSVYTGDTIASDVAAWVPAEGHTNSELIGTAQRSLVALRDIGVIDEVDQITDGVLVYPNANQPPLG